MKRRLLFWLLGVVFYLWVITLILQRLFFYDLPPGDLSPTHTVDRKAAPHHGSVVGWFHAPFVPR